MKVIILSMLNHLAIWTTVVVIMVSVTGPVRASDFMGVEIEGPAVDYVVLRDVNVRAKPETRSKRLTGLKKGMVVYSPGHYQGWAAVLQDGDPLGFAYKKYLLPMINGELAAPITGVVTIAGEGRCKYTISFAGKSEANNAVFKMADYETAVLCEYDGKRIQTIIFMFMTEGPMTRSKPTIHQIGMDVLEIAGDKEYDDILSTNVLYDHAKQQIVFDGVTLKGYGDSPSEAKIGGGVRG